MKRANTKETLGRITSLQEEEFKVKDVMEAKIDVIMERKDETDLLYANTDLWSC